MRLQHLLVPVDFGPAAEHAVDLAIELASKLTGEIALVHVFQLPSLAYMGDPAAEAGGMLPAIIASERSAFDAAVARAQERHPRIRGVWVEGKPRQQIVELAVKRGADLIVMGTHHRRRLARLLMGSVAERVVRTSPIPVLTTAGPAEPGALGSSAAFRNILVPTDFGDPAVHALTVAIQLARSFGAGVTLMHAYDVPVTPFDERLYPPTAEIIRHATINLERALATAKATYERTVSTLVRGDARESILEVAAQRSADLIVMGTHQRRGLPRVFLGSVAESVVRASRIPVLTLGGSGAEAG